MRCLSASIAASEMTFQPIQSRERARQLVSFDGMELGNRLWPTDFDAVIEWHDRAWLLFEVKSRGKDVPQGQRLALERFARDAAKAGKHAVAAIVGHDVADPSCDVRLADCNVREVFLSGECRWRPPKRPIDAGALERSYIEYVERAGNYGA